jgi:hypothetical protein
MSFCTVGGTVDRFGISGPFVLHNPLPQNFGSVNNYEQTISLGFKPAEEMGLTTLQPSEPPIYLTTQLEDRTLAVTTHINAELGKCTALESNTRSRSYGNKQYHMLRYCSFWLS